MLSIIYPYRNRDLNHVRNSLNSLGNQTSKDFKVFFVDYGSDTDIGNQARKICEAFPFVQYKYYSVQDQPWNKSRALNSIIKFLNEGYCFVADIDMLFHPDFIEKAIHLQKPERTVYFQVGFLRHDAAVETKKFKEFKNYRKSTYEATGLSLFPVKALKDVQGFDEFYHFWGAEDTDMHVRLKNAGSDVFFYDEQILMLHQWHPSYRSKEKGILTRDLQINGIVQLNHQHLKLAIERKVTTTNHGKWGRIMTKNDFKKLEELEVNFKLDNEKRKIEDLLYGQFPTFRDKWLKIEIRKSSYPGSFKYKLKKLLGKKVPEYYTLKEINDLVLIHLISFYRNQPYNYKVNPDTEILSLSIKL